MCACETCELSVVWYVFDSVSGCSANERSASVRETHACILNDFDFEVLSEFVQIKTVIEAKTLEHTRSLIGCGLRYE